MKEDQMKELGETEMEEDKKGYFHCGKKLKNMKRKHMLVEKIMVELINVESWSTYEFNEEHLGIPFDGERTMLWATPILPLSDSSVSDKIAKESTKTLENEEISDTMVKESAETVDVNERSDTSHSSKKIEKEFGETPFLIAARMGVIERVKAILQKFPSAISDKRVSDGKNALLLAVENRQINVCDFLIMSVHRSPWKDVRKIQDRKRNNPLHLAAIRGHHQPWRMHGEAMQMLWEFKWYEYVRDSFPSNFTEARNADGKTPWEVFADTHEDQMRTVEGGREWMNKTAQSCSVVASLITTVSFALLTTFPGGNNEQGLPKFRNNVAFNLFMSFAIFALCYALLSLVMFLAVIVSPYQDANAFNKRPMQKLVLGLSFLLSAIVAMLISFSARHFLNQWRRNENSRFRVFTLSYLIAYFPFIIIVIWQFPFHPSLVSSVLKRKPQPWYR